MAETTQVAPANVEPIAGDDASFVEDASLDDSLASLRFSILEYRRENGRTYHRVSDGKYYGPNDEEEKDRLDFAHQLWLLTWDGELCNCPKNDGAKRVLDIGTGTGIWAMDYADAHPEAMVLGVDLSPIQPGFVPPNCYFEVDDVDKEWAFSQPFDFVFMRAMIGSLRDWPKILAQAYENIEPGGYFEIQDNDFPVVCDDGTLSEDSYMLKWTQYLIQATEKIGQPINVAPSFKKLLEDAGFESVEERRVAWPVSAWPEDLKQKEIGKWCRASFMQGMDGICMALFTRVLGWTKEEVIVFCSHVRNEVRRGKIHGYFPVYAAWGKKPEKEAS